MKTKVLYMAVIIVMMTLALGPARWTVSAQEPTLDEQIEQSIVKGLAWLASVQNPNGSWGWEGDCNALATTGMVVLKFETRAIELDMDPLGTEYDYAGVVQSGLNYIMTFTQTRDIGPQPAGNPDTDGDGIGVYFDNCGYHQIYNTGIAMLALAASGHPELYGATLQDSVDFMAWAQTDIDCGPARGGWRYIENACDADNSNSGYVTLGLGYASAPPPWGFGLTIPDFVKSELSLWLDIMQDDVNGDADDGGSWYDLWSPWVNILKTGNLVYEMGLTGDTVETQRVMDAVDYIERHWYDPGGGDVGWRDHRQSMFTMMKGLSGLGIDMIDLDGDNVAEYEWFPEVAQHLIATQNEDGSWPGDPWVDGIMSTAWALLTLEKAVPVIETPVPVDIKPASCPNPFNTNDKGVLPVAIPGTAKLDVTQIDPASVRLVYNEQEVYPLRWALEDVATPYEPFLKKPVDAYACTSLGADGMMDLTFKFSNQAVKAILGTVHAEDILVLTLIGNLKEEFGGTPIHGEDVIKIVFKK